jgi:tetratricopeptide (TPR) repeat protein
MKKYLAYSVCLIFIISAGFVFAEIKSLVKEYTYQASELDSKTTCRAIALEQVKRELLEELGTYVESTTVVQDAQIEKDEIKTLSAGVVQTKILDEKWDGKSFWLKAEVSADPDEVAASIEKLKNDQKLADELAESQAEKEKALEEVERLKAELAQSNADKEKLAQYNDAVKQVQASDSFEKGTAYTVAGNYENAARAYDRVIYYRPNDAKAYFLRSIVFMFLGNYQRATNDLDRAMILRPANTNTYYQRASAYKDIRERRVVNKFSFVQPFAKRPYKPAAQKDDSLQRFLDRKQTEHKFVKVTPLQPVQRRPITKRPDRQLPPRTYQPQQKDQPIDRTRIQPPDRRKDTTVTPPVTEQNQQLLRQKRDEQYRRDLEEKQKSRYYKDREKPIVGQPATPDVRKGTTVPPSGIDQNQQLLQQRKDEQYKRDLSEKQNLRRVQKQEREPAIGQPAKPVGRQDATIPPAKVDRSRQVVQPQPKREVYAPKAPQLAPQQKVVKKTKQQLEAEELEKASRRR